MSNKTRLQTNNTKLDALIERVNAAKDTAASLPENGGSNSGGGATVEMCTGTLVVDAPNMNDFTVYSVNENLEAATVTLDAMDGGTFTAAKGTIVAVTPWCSHGNYNGCTKCFESVAGMAVVISDNFTITYQ